MRTVDLTLGFAHRLLHCADRVDQTLAGTFREIQSPNLLRDFESNARDSSFQSHQLPALLAARLLLFEPEFFKLLQSDPARLVDVLNDFDGPGTIFFVPVFV